MSKATLIVDLQFGSTGKGLIAGYLAERDKPDVVVNANTPSAGHTYIDAHGTEYIFKQLPNGIVSPKVKIVLLGPGSVVNLETLEAEINQARRRGQMNGASVLIHRNAAILRKSHVDGEERSSSRVGIGSTRKGAGAAIQEKLDRSPEGMITAGQSEYAEAVSQTSLDIGIISHRRYLNILEAAERIQVEGAQGYSLGINSGQYPYVTSRECTPAQLCSDTLLPLKYVHRVVGVARTFPIRVANRYDESGNMVGWSGPHYPDQQEIDWSDIGVEPETTTVTKLPRRVFTFSTEQMEEAMFACQPDEVFLNFAQYPSRTDLDWMVENINGIADCFGIGGVRYLGWGPTANDVQEI